MGTLSYLKGVFVATWSGLRHLTHPRMTLRYPEQKLDLEGSEYPITPRRPAGLPPGYKYDPKEGVGLPGFKGRHILLFDKCTGCDLCAIACDGVAVAIEMQHIPKGLKQNRREIWPAVDYGRCVPPWTPVVSSKGIIPIKEIQVGDEVLTHTGSFKKVTEVFRRKHTGRIYTFKTLGNPEPLTVTDGHPILVQRSEGSVWVMPEQIKYRDYLTRPIIKEERNLPCLGYTHEQYHPAGRGGYFTLETNVLAFTQELARLVGYYLSEGSVERYRVSFDINKHEEALAADIIACVRAVFGREDVAIKPDKRSDGLKLVVDSVRIAAFFKQFGTKCDEKVLPPWALTIALDLQSQLIKSAYLGDGHYSNKFYEYEHSMHSNYFVIRTTSQALADQYTYILNRLGIVSSICKNQQKNRKLCYSVTVHTPYIEKMSELTGVPAKNSPSFAHSYIKMTNDMILSPVVEISVKDVKEFEVLNLEVEDDNTYIASNQIVHNCVFCGLCVDPETEVTTNPGIKPIREISIGENVLTHTGNYRPVTRIWRFDYSGPLYTINIMGKPDALVCTADHKVLAVRRPVSGKRDRRLLRTTQPLEMVLPQNLKNGDYLLTPVPKKVINLNEYKVEFDGRRGKKELILRTEPNLFRLIGYYVAEGSLNDGSRTVYFSFGSTEDSLITDASNLLKKYFSKEPGIDLLRHHVANVRIGSTLALRFFSQFGRGAPNKFLPDWVFFAERDKQVQLIKGIWLGDGCVVNQARQRYLNITTTSKVLANQIQLILARLGIVSTVAVEAPKDKLPVYRVNVFGKWAIRLAKLLRVEFEYSPSKSADKFFITSDYIYSPIVKLGRESVRGRSVMDITVDVDHTFVGQGIAQHNCVDACPFDALYMTNDYELAAYDKMSLKYTPDMLAVPPKLEGKTYKVKIDAERGTTSHG